MDDESKQMLFDLYLHDYLVKKNLSRTAEVFKDEANVSKKSPEIDSLDGLLHEWWTVFYDVLLSKQLNKDQEGEEKPSDTAEQNELQNIYNPVSEFDMSFEQMSEYMMALQRPSLSPNPSSQQQQILNHSQQLVARQSRIGNSTSGPDSVGFNHSGVQRGIFPLSISSNTSGFTFQESGSFHSSNRQVLCIHFSSDGRLLASAGDEKKVCIWDWDANTNNSIKGHSLPISDVRFAPNSTRLATSSFDKTVRIWDAAKPTKALLKLQGHTEGVLALDFHPKRVEVLCSCSTGDEIRLWDVNSEVCLKDGLKGATRQVRFHPTGNYLFTATGNSIKQIDTRNYELLRILTGHVKEVSCICWHKSGQYMASVSEDSARVWTPNSISKSRCLCELQSDGYKFQSCTFNPGHPPLLIIACHQSLLLWNPIDGSQTWKVTAHDWIIHALADSQQMIASASYDGFVKIWK